MRSSVSMVMRLPSRSRCTSLPSLTVRRPNVVSAMSAWRQNSVIWLRIWSFFIGRRFWEMLVGSRGWLNSPTTTCPPSIRVENGNSVIGTRGTSQYTRRQNDTSGCECLNDIAPWPCCCLQRWPRLLRVIRTKIPTRFFSGVYERLGELPARAARDPYVWLRLEDLKREPCDQKSSGD